MTSIGDLPCRRRASAPTHSVNSNFGQAVLWSGHGTDDLSLSFGRGSRAFGGGPSRSQPAAEACGAGTDHPRLGRAAGRGGDRPPRRHQPAGGVALAAALRRSRRRRAVARHDQKAGQAAHARRDRSGVVALTCGAPPGEATHWTGRTMAKAAGLSLRTVQRIWAAHKLRPHRIRTFKRSRDPEFSAKLADIVGLYLAPLRHAVAWRARRTAWGRRCARRGSGGSRLGDLPGSGTRRVRGGGGSWPRRRLRPR